MTNLPDRLRDLRDDITAGKIDPDVITGMLSLAADEIEVKDRRIAELEDDLGVVDAWRNKVIADNERLRAALEKIENEKLYDPYSEWDDGYNAAWNSCKRIASEALAAVEASDE